MTQFTVDEEITYVSRIVAERAGEDFVLRFPQGYDACEDGQGSDWLVWKLLGRVRLGLQEWVRSQMGPEVGTLGKRGLQGPGKRGTSGESGAAAGEEGRHSKWWVDGATDADNRRILLMSVFSKVKMAALVKGSSHSLGSDFPCLGNLDFWYLLAWMILSFSHSSPFFFFLMFVHTREFLEPSPTVSGSHTGGECV